jgi:hypothetical protein
LVDLRSKIREELSDVQDAGNSLFWDDTRPNRLTRSNLFRLYQHAREGAEAFGVYILARHADCGSRSHKEDYVMEPIGNREVAYGDPSFVWSHPLDQATGESACPCSKSTKARKHWVIYDLIYDKRADQAFCVELEKVLTDLYEAAGRAGPKKPRSAIREYLLRALLVVNDQILPEPVEAYIASRSAADGEQ